MAITARSDQPARSSGFAPETDIGALPRAELEPAVRGLVRVLGDFRDPLGLARAPVVEAPGGLRVRERQDRGGEERRVDRARLADGQGADRDAADQALYDARVARANDECSGIALSIDNPQNQR